MSNVIKIKENHIFRRAYRRGTSLVSPYVVVYLMKNRCNQVRIGITTGKKIGGAVPRNRAKRVIMSAFRSCLPKIAPGHDFIIVARSRILDIKSTQLELSLMKILNTAGVLMANQEND